MLFSITNASNKKHGEEELDSKLFFVSITRTQHYVGLFYHQELTALLNSLNVEEQQAVEEIIRSYDK